MIEQHHEPGSIVWTERNNATDLYATWALVSPINATRLHLHRLSIVCSTEEMRSTEHLPLHWETT